MIYHLPDGQRVRCESKRRYVLIAAPADGKAYVVLRSDNAATIRAKRRTVPLLRGGDYYRGDSFSSAAPHARVYRMTYDGLLALP